MQSRGSGENKSAQAKKIHPSKFFRIPVAFSPAPVGFFLFL